MRPARATSATSIPFPPIERHAVIGDRRTAALVAADGTIDWMCLPDYDGEPVFGSLVDGPRGGSFRFAPVERAWGVQRYVEDTAVVETVFRGGDVVGRDAMLLVDEPGATAHVVIRQLRATKNGARCVMDLAPRRGARGLGVFFSHAARSLESAAGSMAFDLHAGEEAWVVVTYGDRSEWSVERGRDALEATIAGWQRWASRLTYEGARRGRVIRSLLTIRLLQYAKTGSLVAAPTTSLPERVGGSANYDYRLSWVRDASLSVEALAKHGDCESPRRYLDWLASLLSKRDPPLQVVYRIDGRKDAKERERRGFAGYRSSKPVRVGNRAYAQKQLGIYGFLADCALAYERAGGAWRREFFDLVARGADFVARHWSEPDNGIWELQEKRDHVASRVMSWFALARAGELAETLGLAEHAKRWRGPMNAIHDEVMARGFSERLGAFRQEYGSEALDASALLIPITGFLPGDHPRVVSTVDRIASDLTINGHVHRFVPSMTLGKDEPPMGEHEGSFFLCTCWLATAYALGGRRELAERTLERVDEASGELGLLAEGIDARGGAFLGNYPLLFSHAEYLRAVRALGHEPSRGR